MKPSPNDSHALAKGKALELVKKGLFSEARDCYYQTLYLKPASADVFLALGVCCYECNQIDEALAYTQASIALNPENAEARVQAGLICLLKGQALQGWDGFAYRKKTKALTVKPPPPLPPWNGEPLKGQGIVLIHEQGLGDIIQCVRYAKMIIQQGARVYLDIQEPLRRLFSFQTNFGVTLELGQSAEISTYAHFMDLPARFSENILNPQAQGAYISLPAQHRGTATVNTPGTPLKVGLAWSGSALNVRDKIRSIGLEKLQPIFGLTGCHFYSLQSSAGTHNSVEAGLAQAIARPNPIHDFFDLAVAIDNMDLVISVDTAVAHLAGAMGKPTWLLVSCPADWRWGTNGTDTGWYSSVQLFRQPSPGDWKTPIDAVARALTV